MSALMLDQSLVDCVTVAESVACFTLARRFFFVVAGVCLFREFYQRPCPLQVHPKVRALRHLLRVSVVQRFCRDGGWDVVTNSCCPRVSVHQYSIVLDAVGVRRRRRVE